MQSLRYFGGFVVYGSGLMFVEKDINIVVAASHKKRRHLYFAQRMCIAITIVMLFFYITHSFFTSWILVKCTPSRSFAIAPRT